MIWDMKTGFQGGRDFVMQCKGFGLETSLNKSHLEAYYFNGDFDDIAKNAFNFRT